MSKTNITILDFPDDLMATCMSCNKQDKANKYIHSLPDLTDPKCDSLCRKCFGEDDYNTVYRNYNNKIKLQKLPDDTEYCNICYDTKKLLPCYDKHNKDILVCLYCFKQLTERGKTDYIGNLNMAESVYCFLCCNKNDLIEYELEDNTKLMFCKSCFERF